MDEKIHTSETTLLFAMHLLVLAGSLLMITLVSMDMLHNISFLQDERYRHVQLWICLVYLTDIIISFVLSPRRWRYAFGHAVFFIICVPYLNLFSYFDIALSPTVHYVLHFLPFVRVAYVVSIVIGAFKCNRVVSMVAAYVTLLIIVVYLSSVVFFVEEHNVNPDVKTYWPALYWAILNLDTVGCEITEYTVTGKVLSVVLSAGGLILFPVFTVFFSNAIAQKSEK
jgi:hypothetical protein